jgi:4'-phosphopantetheinyl transferase EntD
MSSMRQNRYFKIMTNLPLSVVLKVCGIGAAQGSLVGSEFQLLEGAKATRQRELIAGRTLARRAMAEMGLAEASVGQLPDGSPAWPTGLCGSIAHSHRHVAVAIAPVADVRAIGIDIEDGRDLGAAAAGVASVAEIEGAIAHPLAGDREGAARLLFSAKEALYKCQAPLTGNTTLDFLEIRLNLQSGRLFAAEATGALDRATAEIIQRVRIEFQEIQGVIVVAAWLPYGT